MNRLLGFGYDVNYSGPGWYMDILTDEADPEWFALYPGQSINAGKMARYHKSYHLTVRRSQPNFLHQSSTSHSDASMSSTTF
jgi:hypothetical protein